MLAGQLNAALDDVKSDVISIALVPINKRKSVVNGSNRSVAVSIPSTYSNH